LIVAIARRSACGTALFAGALAVLVCLGGCGSSTAQPDPTRVAQLVAEARALCSRSALRADRVATPALEALGAHLQRIENALEKAAAYLPAGRALNEAHAERRIVTAELVRASDTRHLEHGPPRSIAEHFYRLQVQIREDLTALGLGRCIIAPPRRPISG
jgi:hypothetical protein